jgi:hypothetical protein
MKHIVVYMGGTCGDLVTALLDPFCIEFGPHGNVVISENRSRLKKPHLFDSDTDKDQYLNDTFDWCDSLPSHDLDYHVRQHHKFIGIVVNTAECANWAASRFQKLHRPEVWEEMVRACGATDVDGYAQMILDFSNMLALHTQDVLSLEDILAGNAITQLHKITNCPLTSSVHIFYQHWLETQSYNETMFNKSFRRSQYQN